MFVKKIETQVLFFSANLKGNLSYIDELVETIATKTREQIVHHEEWYVKYLSLNEAKKQAIKQWKETKKSSVNEVVSQVDAELKLNQEIEKELKNRFERQRKLEKQERNKKLNEWKVCKKSTKVTFPKRSERIEWSAGLVVCISIIRQKKVNSVSKRPFFSALLIARVFQFFPIFKKFSGLKIATTFG
jgi:hypothetical protein